MFPVRCYTCNAVLAHLYPDYDARVRNGERAIDAFHELGIARMCCRRMFLGYVDVTRDLLPFSNVDEVLDKGGTTLHRKVDMTRVYGCA